MTTYPTKPETLMTQAQAKQRIKALGGEGILMSDDLPRLCASEQQIETLLRSGKKYTAYELQKAVGNIDDIKRRLRQAARKLEREGWGRHSSIKTFNPRIWEYWMTPPDGHVSDGA